MKFFHGLKEVRRERKSISCFLFDFFIYLNIITNLIEVINEKKSWFIKFPLIFLFLLFIYSHFAVAGEIHESIFEGNIENIQTLIQKDPSLVNIEDENGVLPLFLAIHMAVYSNRWDIVEFLVINGANPNVTDKNENTPLNLTIYWKQPKTVEILVQHEADVNARGRNGFTPLHEAIYADQLEIVSILLENEADINARTRSGLTPLEVATHLNRQEIKAFLIEKGAKKRSFLEKINEPFWQDYYSEKPLQE